MKKPPD